MTPPASNSPPLGFPYAPAMQVLDRLRKHPIGAMENRLCIGFFSIAFHEDTLVIENALATYLIHVQPDAIRVIIGKRRVLIDMWLHSSSSVALTGSAAEIEAARTYFTNRGLAVYEEPEHA